LSPYLIADIQLSIFIILFR